MGRPKQFDPDAAVEQAMDVFWGQGYGATTPHQLAERLRIGKGSMYREFGGKRPLYDLALARYLGERVQSVGAMLERPGPTKDILRHVLRYMVETDFERSDRRGCFATNSAIEFGRTDADVTGKLLELFRHTETAFAALIERGQRAGDIRLDLRPAEVAGMLLTTVTGLHVLARVEPGPEPLLSVVDATVDLL